MNRAFWWQLDRALSRLRPHRQPMCLLVDVLVVAVCWQATYLFRLGFDRWWSARPFYDGFVLAGVLIVYLVCFLTLGVPRGMWRFSGFNEVRWLAWACACAGAVCAVLVLMAQLRGVPRAVLALHPLVSLMGLCIARMAYRMVYEHGRARLQAGPDVPGRALVLGAGEAASRLIAGVQQQGWTVVGLLDDDPGKQQGRIAGVPVLGTLADGLRPDRLDGITHLIVALPGSPASVRRQAIAQASSTGLPVLTVPTLDELHDGSGRVEKVRNIEPEDLLGREPVSLDEAGVAELVSGKTALVTGAGGSIGSELCRQAARYGASRLILFELSELALYQVEQQLGELHPQLPLVPLIGDVRDARQVAQTLRLHRPHLVFHAAAFKHVPLMEDNAWQALQNNVLGTLNTARAAIAAGAECFVLISTDKAVNPTNVMGASKRAAEMVVSQLSASTSGGTRLMAVRFGNVLGSSGSVIPKFQEQIARGGPVTVTHRDITRYFMTVSEAGRLVLQAAALADGGQVYVMDMGEPVRIVDLARQLIRLSGHRDDDIAIVYSGLRPGEKLFEELLADADHTMPSAHPRLRIARLDRSAGADWLPRIEAWLAEPNGDADLTALRERLTAFVPEYRRP